MANNHAQLAKDIVRLVGGKGNVTQAWHCITRLRFNLVDASKVDAKGINALNGVLSTQFQGDQFQIIVGNHVANVYAELKGELGELSAEGDGKKQKISPLNAVFDTISGIFNPLMPAIIGAGLLKGVLSLLIFLQWINPSSSEYMILNMISDGTFYFLPFLLAFSAAEKFKTNKFVAASLAGILMYPAFAGLEGGTVVKFFFLSIPAANYSSSVLPIILSVLLLSFVYRFFDKVIPQMLRLIFAPLLSLLVTAPIMLYAIAPLGNYIGIYVAKFFIWLFAVAGPVAGLLLGGFMPFIVMTGMHYALFPAALDSLGRLGYDIMLLPMNLVSNMAQFAATLGVAAKTKDRELRSVALSSALSAVFGITEPAMYGVTLKLKKPLYAAMIGSGIGGAIMGFATVKAFAFSIPGITSLPSYLSAENPSNFLFACIGVLVSMTLAFVLTIVTYKDPAQEKPAAKKPVGRTVGIAAPMTGKTVSLAELGDSVFASEVLGKGIGILPVEDVVLAPFDGKISVVANTLHALGLASADGVELLIHVGMNTVTLEGKGFKALVKTGDVVKKGQPLLEFDSGLIRQSGLSTASAIIVTNSEDYSDIACRTGKEVKAGAGEILAITD